MARRSLSVIVAAVTLVATGCVSTGTYQKKVDESAARAQTIQNLESEQKRLQDAVAQCTEEKSVCEKHRADEASACARRTTEQQEKFSRAQADIERLEKVLSDRSQETGKAMTEMRQSINRLTDENRTLTADRQRLSEENALLSADKKVVTQQYDALVIEKTRIEQENQKLVHAVDEEKRIREEQLAKVKSTYGELIDKMKTEIERGEITISDLQGKLTVNMVERILFDSGSADVKSGGKEVLRKVGGILAGIKDKEVRVEGHSDNVPISSKLQERYPSNWDLSAARAINVLQFLKSSVDIPGERLVACGFGEFRPIADNSTAEGRAQNRRIQIVLTPLDAKLEAKP